MNTIALVFALALASTPLAPPPATPEAVVEAVNVANAKLDAWSAEFLERRRYVHFDTTEERRGQIQFRRDGGLRIDLTDPSPQSIVLADGTAKLWKPGTNQFHVYKLGDRKLSADQLPIPFVFGDKGWAPAAANRLTLLEQTGDVVGLELIPIDEASAYRRQLIWFSLETWLPVRVQLTESATDDEIEFVFSTPVGAPPPSLDSFQLRAPEGAELVEHDELPKF